MDAIELLKKDHQEVTKLFQRFSRGGRDRDAVLDQICTELDVHARIEEEIFYPAVRKADGKLGRVVDEAYEEHARVKQQVSDLRNRRGGSRGRESEDGADGLEARVTALQQDVEHHVTEEEGEMFPEVRNAIDARERSTLGEELQARKQELMGRGTRSSTSRSRETGRQASSRSRTSRAKTGARRRTKSKGGRAKARATTRRATRARTTGGRAKSAKGGRKRARGGGRGR